ncbi:hypothetical protein HHK36_006368 [Tetracentron sinense]|uniref:40S ribosomal protein S12 n=1 Tax=Tetracentron sinense TaxID=13715 RepID=A0A834ZPF5_TETSI|nr:hypothetical protein HHK36_006368 [Tetracentron sinense]
MEDRLIELAIGCLNEVALFFVISSVLSRCDPSKSSSEEGVFVAETSGPALGEPMDNMKALELVLKKSMDHYGLARGFREGAKVIKKHAAQLCVLAEDCDQMDSVKVIKALCADHNVSLIVVPSSKTLGEWAGLCKIDAKGKARKVVGCSCVVVKDYGEEPEGLDIVREHVKSEEGVFVAETSGPALGEPMDIMMALELVLKKSMDHYGLARGFHEGAKVIKKHAAQLCVLAEDCDQMDSVKMIKALCADHNVSLIVVPSSKTLGEWAGLCKIDAKGKARKVVGCSCVVVKDYGEEPEGLDIVQEHVKSEEGVFVAETSVPALGEPMDIMTALELVLKKSMDRYGLARGFREGAKVIKKHAAQLCVLAEDCDQMDSVKMIKALCADHNVSLIVVPSSKTLGEWAGLCKIDAKGKARKVVGCSCVVVKDYGEEPEGLDIVREHVKSH